MFAAKRSFRLLLEAMEFVSYEEPIVPNARHRTGSIGGGAITTDSVRVYEVCDIATTRTVDNRESKIVRGRTVETILGIPLSRTEIPADRSVSCSRTINLKSFSVEHRSGIKRSNSKMLGVFSFLHGCTHGSHERYHLEIDRPS